jgi:UDP-GlcNAc:undecaprenyl-phosphate GlcNAc-1-phosphate transferase
MEFNLSSTVFMFEAILGGLGLTLLTGWIGIRLARRAGLLDYPGAAPHKQHSVPMPLAGGIALALSLAILFTVTGGWANPDLRRAILPTVIIFAMGLWDDLKGMRALAKLSVQVAAAVILIASGIYIQIFETETFFVGGHGALYLWIDYALTIIWVVGVTNAFNLVDSMDGLGTGLSAWAFGFFMLATYYSGQTALSLVCALILGICIALYFYNAPPAKLFLGDSGDQTLGFLMAVMAILYSPLDALQSSSWFVPILLVGVPVFDTALVFISRLRRGLPFYQAGTDHTYHRLVALGLDANRAVLVMHFTALVLECLAFVAVSLPPLQANGVFAACLLAGLAFILILDGRKQPA